MEGGGGIYHLDATHWAGPGYLRSPWGCCWPAPAQLQVSPSVDTKHGRNKIVVACRLAPPLQPGAAHARRAGLATAHTTIPECSPSQTLQAKLFSLNPALCLPVPCKNIPCIWIYCRRPTRHRSMFYERMLRVANRGRMHRTRQCLHHIYCGL